MEIDFSTPISEFLCVKRINISEEVPKSGENKPLIYQG